MIQKMIQKMTPKMTAKMTKKMLRVRPRGVLAHPAIFMLKQFFSGRFLMMLKSRYQAGFRFKLDPNWGSKIYQKSTLKNDQNEDPKNGENWMKKMIKMRIQNWPISGFKISKILGRGAPHISAYLCRRTCAGAMRSNLANRRTALVARGWTSSRIRF